MIDKRTIWYQHYWRWRKTYLRRLVEFLFWRKHKKIWLAGYGQEGPSLIAIALEWIIRLAELLGVGLIYQAVEIISSGAKYRRLSEGEEAFAKTYFKGIEFTHVVIDERASLFAKRLKVAYVSGFIIKGWGALTPPLLVHELVHVRQFRRWGWAYVAKALSAQWLGSGYTYDRAFAVGLDMYAQNQDRRHSLQRAGLLRKHLSFRMELNAEQEAARIEDNARQLLGLDFRWAR